MWRIQRLVDVFLNAVYINDDKILVVNGQEGAETLRPPRPQSVPDYNKQWFGYGFVNSTQRGLSESPSDPVRERSVRVCTRIQQHLKNHVRCSPPAPHSSRYGGMYSPTGSSRAWAK